MSRPSTDAELVSHCGGWGRAVNSSRTLFHVFIPSSPLDSSFPDLVSIHKCDYLQPCLLFSQTVTLYQAQYHADFKKMTRVWHKFGALGRLHNLIRHIRLSLQRRQEFKQCQSDRESWKDFNKLEVSKYSIQLYCILLFINSSS